MPATNIFSNAIFPSLSAGQNNFVPMGHGEPGASTTESITDSKILQAGTISRLGIQLDTNDRGAGSFTFRKGVADTALAVTLPAATTGWLENVTGTEVAVSVGDVVNDRISVGTGGSTFTWRGIRHVFTPSDPAITHMRYMAGLGNNISTASTTFFHGLAGAQVAQSTVEANAQWICRVTGYTLGLGAQCRTNTRATDTLVRFGKNGGNGAQFATVLAGNTGWFADASATDDVAPGDLIDISVSTGTGTGNVRFNTTVIGLNTLDGSFHHLCTEVGGVAVPAGGTLYPGVGSTLSTAATTEAALVQVYVPFTVSLLQGRFPANTTTATSVLSLRRNGVTVASMTIGAGVVGFLEQAITPVLFQRGDTICWQITAGTGGTLTYTGLGYLGYGITPRRATIVSTAVHRAAYW